MIKIENVEVLGWEHAIRGMRNPLNSWDKSDSGYENNDWMHCPLDCTHFYDVGDNDLDLMKRLANAGTDHSKYRRMIVVYADITSSLYFFKEFDTYKVGTVANSCSTMHKIHAKEFTLDDFSHEHCGMLTTDVFLQHIIPILNINRELFLETKDKNYWWQMIQLLPSSYNQKRTVMLNYEVLANMYKSRKSHKLDEWIEFCKWIETLPYSELITGKEVEEHE